MTTEYVRRIERAFASAPFRVEFREYPQPAGAPGIWQVMHQCNGAIITTGATPAAAIESLKRMTDTMIGVMDYQSLLFKTDTTELPQHAFELATRFCVVKETKMAGKRQMWELRYARPNVSATVWVECPGHIKFSKASDAMNWAKHFANVGAFKRVNGRGSAYYMAEIAPKSEPVIDWTATREATELYLTTCDRWNRTGQVLAHCLDHARKREVGKELDCHEMMVPVFERYGLLRFVK